MKARSVSAVLTLSLFLGITTATPALAGTNSGSLFAWGANGTGQLGTGTTTSSPTPLQLSLAGASDVVGGGRHGLARTSNGRVYGWGRNFYGQTGNGTFGLANVTSPRLVATLSGVVGVAAGEDHSLAVLADGSVWGWGNNSNGQLGFESSALPFTGTPVRVQGFPASDPVIAVAAGQAHSVALTASGSVFTWGSNLQGQLGIGPVPSVAFTPQRVSLLGVTRIAARDLNTLAIANPGGHVYGWGDNSSGQLNDAASNGRFAPIPVNSGVEDAAGIAVGANFSVARHKNGTVSTWGANETRQLGRSEVATPNGPPGIVADLTDVVEISAGSRHVLATLATGALKAWGDNAAGQLGTGTAGGFSASPTQIGAFASIVDAAGGSNFTYAIAAPIAELTPATLTFPGTIEIGATTQSLDAVFKNKGPGPLKITSASIDELSEFRFSDGGDHCSGGELASGESCSMSIEFSPLNPGYRTGLLVVESDAFNGTQTMPLEGLASVVAGQISIETDIAHLIDGVRASPPRVPLGDIPLQSSSAAIKDAVSAGDLAIGDVVSAGDLAIGDVISSGDLAIGDVISSGDLAIGDVISSGDLAIGDVISSGPLAREALKQISLASLPLGAPYRWDGDSSTTPTPIIAPPSSLHAIPLQNISLFDVVTDPVSGPRFAEVSITKIGFGSSKLRSVGLLAILLGKTPLENIVIPPALTAEETWCPDLNAALGTSDCGLAYARDPASDPNGLTASALEFQLGGIPFGALRLDRISVADIREAAADTPFLDLKLAPIDLYRADLGAVALSDVTPDVTAVADCSQVSCTEGTLHDAQSVDALIEGAALGDLGDGLEPLSILQLVLALLPQDADPYGAVTLSDLGILPYAGPGTTSIGYDVRFVNDAADSLPDGATLAVTMPGPEFTYVPGSTSVVVDGEARPSVEPTRDGRVLRWPVSTDVPALAVLTLSFELRPGLTLGTFAIPRLSLDGSQASVVSTVASAPVRVIEALEGSGLPANDEVAQASSIEPSGPGTSGELVVSHVAHRGDRDLFVFSADPAKVPPDSLLTLHLEHLETDLDLAIFAPHSTQEAPLRAGGTSSSAVPLTDSVPGFDNSSVSLESDPQSDIDLVEGLPLAGLSQNRGTTSEFIRLVAGPGASASDQYVVEVMGYDGTYSSAPYSLRVIVTPPPPLAACQARNLPLVPSSVSGAMPSSASLVGADTIYLVAPARLEKFYGEAGRDQIMSALNRVVSDQELAAVVGSSELLPVDADEATSGIPTAVQSAFDAWDANPCDSRLANAVVRAITGLVDRKVPASVKNIVLVGGDDVIPMGRHSDLTIRVSEFGFLNEITAATFGNNSLVGSVARSKVLSDDAFALPDVVALPGRYAYVPTVALGRLVETPAEIAGTVHTYVDFKGTVDANTALTTAADGFLEDLGRAIDAELSASMGSQQQTLIDGSWGVDQLRQSLTQNDAPDVVSLNGHSDPWRTQPKVASSEADLFTSKEVRDTGSQLNGIWFSIGCHTGLPVSNAVLKLSSRGPEWSQAVLGNYGAAFIGQTGYGLGARSTIALSEEILLSFAKNMSHLTLGDSLLAAKRAFYADAGMIDVFSEKSLAEAVFYGIPNVRAAGISPRTYAPPTLDTGTDAATGLAKAEIHLQSTNPEAPGYFALNRNDRGSDGSFFDANGQTLVATGRPIQPQLSLDVTRPGMRAHGALITDLVSVDQPGDFDPVIAVTQATGGIPTEVEPQPGDVAFPSAIQSIRSASQAAGGRDKLVLVPGIFQSSTSSGKTAGLQRLFTSIRASVLYSESSDFVPPVIMFSEGVVAQDSVTFVADVTDTSTPTDRVEAVVIVYREVGADHWKSLNLINSPADASRWTGGAAVSAETVEYFVQAVDRSGNVATSENKARFRLAQQAPASEGGVSVSLNGLQTPRDGWYVRASLALMPGEEGEAITYRVDGGEESLYSAPISFFGDGQTPVGTNVVLGDGHHWVSYSSSAGASGFVVVRIDANGPLIDVTVPKPNGTSVYGLGQVARLNFSCSDGGSGMLGLSARCEAEVDGTPIANGDKLPTDQAGPHTIVLHAEDAAGNTSTRTLAYRVGYVFDGFMSPIANLPASNLVKAGSNVSLKWRLYDGNGEELTSLGTVRSVGSFRIDCNQPPPPSLDPPPGDGASSELKYDGLQFHYNWKTKSGTPPTGFTGTCRRFVLTLADGSLHMADFAFN